MRLLCLTVGSLAVAASLFSLNSSEPESAATFSGGIGKLIYTKCTSCHRKGEIGPFPLESYADAKKWSKMIEVVTDSKRMPPWKPLPGHGEFADENRLSDSEIKLVKDWVAAGSPRGVEREEPKPPKFSSEWALGKPDVIISPKTETVLSAEGKDEYRNFIIRTDFKETKYIRAMDCKPGNPSVVHHIVVYTDETGRSHRLENDQDGKEGYLTNGGVSPGFIPDAVPYIWAPGLRPRPVAEGVGFELKPGATLVLQVHYHKNGKEEKDLSKVGLYLSKEPFKKIAEIEAYLDPMIRIPAGEKKHVVERNYTVHQNWTMYSIMPHMHLLGKEMRADLILPDGTEKPLIYVNDWDFNWQMNYAFTKPISIPAKSKIRVRAVYDNSSENPRNPHSPPREVRFGEGTTDEMFVLIFTITRE